jgi:hypothetical protein
MELPHAPSSEPASARHFSARSLLPLGFCGVFLLMAAAMVESYRIEGRMEKAPAVFATYDRDEILLERVRHGFNQSQNVVRAFVLHDVTTEACLANLRRSESEVMEALDQIGHKEMFEKIPGARAIC